MKQFFDFFPVMLFVVAYYMSKDMILSTKVLLAASVVQIAVFWLWKRTVEKMHLGTFVVVLVMGSLTIFLDDPIFIVWKPSIVNWSVAAVLLVSLLIKKNLVRKAAEGFLKQTPHLSLNMPETKWAPMCLIWVLYFIALGVINLFVYFTYGEDFWVTFKLVGFTIINIAFFIGQFVYLSRYISEIKPDNNQESQG
ncbi:inner membrane-spanning protein YciB [Ketobacter sp.]|uniref:inner membrane-spanning protein YciB n=1 Tax=Ketobacter sp. TaxID=2083498 RepID=UPI000F12D1A5|nr:inner membrane-spanning protein YciB [Ketobacter sp.]RLT92526.1 MAG: septation protein IspZ [Ketobacter sp.]